MRLRLQRRGDCKANRTCSATGGQDATGDGGALNGNAATAGGAEMAPAAGGAGTGTDATPGGGPTAVDGGAAAIGLSLVSFQLLNTPADPGFWLRFRSGPVLTYPRTFRSGPRESLARTQAWRAGNWQMRPMLSRHRRSGWSGWARVLGRQRLMASRYRSAGWEDPVIIGGALTGQPCSEPAPGCLTARPSLLPGVRSLAT